MNEQSKSTLEKILQINRIVRLARKKCLRLIDSKDLKSLEKFIVVMNTLMEKKDEIENINLDRTRKILTLDIVLSCESKLREVVAKY